MPAVAGMTTSVASFPQGHTSCPDVIRASTSDSAARKRVDGRDTPGNDEWLVGAEAFSTTKGLKPKSPDGSWGPVALTERGVSR